MNCGHELMRRCSSCQTELPQAARFCLACGQPVLVETTTDANRLSRLTAAVPAHLGQKIRSASELTMSHPTGVLGEQRTITTLLVDVVGSTALSIQLGEKPWMGVIDRTFDIVAPIIYSFEGTIVRTLGDSLLAFFGAPVAHEDDPHRAVRAGMEIIAQMQVYSRELMEQHGILYAMRVCINTGPVVIGPVSEDLTYDYTSDSGTVNLTSRIKFASQSMDVLITGNTFRYIAPYFECENVGPVEVKGLVDPVQVYRVKAARAILGQTRGFKDLTSPMVGRERELATLTRLCEAVRAGLGRAVLIVGEPGLGKTRLIQEWQKAVKGEYSSTAHSIQSEKQEQGQWVTGRCTSYSQGAA